MHVLDTLHWRGLWEVSLGMTKSSELKVGVLCAVTWMRRM